MGLGGRKLQHRQHGYRGGQDFAIEIFWTLSFDWMSMSLRMANVSLGRILGSTAGPS